MKQELDTSYLNATLAPIMHLIEDETVNEIKISPLSKDIGSVWYYSKGQWEQSIDKYGDLITIDNKKIEQIIGFMAGSENIFAHNKSPVIECAIPILGYRFTGILQPASIGCSKFNIRKFSTKLFTLEDYADQGMYEQEYVEVLRNWLLNQTSREKRGTFTIAVAGTTNTGKTTFICSLINEKRKLFKDQNWVVIEDTKELTIPAGNVDRLLTTPYVDMDKHLKTTLRLTPDCCVVGEVRGKEASTVLELAQISNTMFSMHAKNLEQSLSRFERMMLKHPDIEKISREDIADNINGIICLQNIRTSRRDENGNTIIGFKRVVSEIGEINGYDSNHGKYSITKLK